MKFEISSLNIISSDYSNLEDDFWVNLQVDISEIGGEGAEVFNINVVGCGRISKIIEGNNILMGRGIIIAKNFTSQLVINIIEDLIIKKQLDNWQTLISELSKHFDYL